MVKRLLGISLILFANLILLAHNAIPHHHHPYQVCLVTSHCHSGESASHSHESEMTSHEHDGTNENEPCTLKQVVAVPPGQFRFDFWGSDLPSFNDTGFDIFNSGTDDTVFIFNATDQIILYSFLHLSNSPSYCINSCGLRAPPIV
jgi:hypothetical protein